jgi:hypothetical protein
MLPQGLASQLTTDARIIETTTGTYRLEILPGEKGSYRLAQLDDYCMLARRDFAWRPGFRLLLQARASAGEIPGTWGFGLWNDPFGMYILNGAGVLRLPALPNAAWFFFASPPNYLTIWDNLPARGNLASTWRSRCVPTPLLALGAPILPFSLIPPVMRVLRRLARGMILQDAVDVPIDAAMWHTYGIEWQPEYVRFQVDESTVLQTTIVPQGPLGLVLWIDNQYAALPPSGMPGYGTLPTPQNAWIEVRELSWGQVRES